MPTKLNRHNRLLISIAILNHRFQKEDEALIAQEDALAVMLYNDLFSSSERNLIDSLPKGWLETDNHVYLSIQPGSIYTKIKFRENRPLPGFVTSNARKTYDDKSAVASKYFLLRDAKQKLKASREEAKRTVDPVLASVTTVEALIKQWPEVAPFAESFIPLKAVNHPIVLPVKKLNKLLNLP